MRDLTLSGREVVVVVDVLSVCVCECVAQRIEFLGGCGSGRSERTSSVRLEIASFAGAGSRNWELGRESNRQAGQATGTERERLAGQGKEKVGTRERRSGSVLRGR